LRLFEKELPAKPDILLPDEITALQKLISDEFVVQEFTADTARRLRLAFACLRLPAERIGFMEQAAREELSGYDELIDTRAGSVVVGRDAGDEAKYASFLRAPTEESGEAYLRSLHTHTISLEGLADTSRHPVSGNSRGCSALLLANFQKTTVVAFSPLRTCPPSSCHCW
jgi:hypothetical protein